ncbi:hypothetical protein WJX84_010842 [Apatococcus fuscideae]|uniref:Centromere protein J C-terminal domain-containing protein n=1 Tax=Apatococcus fuscideae TaxID=2026836 RepID=A0AAW1T8Q8_9CHLO
MHRPRSAPVTNQQPGVPEAGHLDGPQLPVWIENGPAESRSSTLASQTPTEMHLVEHEQRAAAKCFSRQPPQAIERTVGPAFAMPHAAQQNGSHAVGLPSMPSPASDVLQASQSDSDRNRARREHIHDAVGQVPQELHTQIKGNGMTQPSSHGGGGRPSTEALRHMHPSTRQPLAPISVNTYPPESAILYKPPTSMQATPHRASTDWLPATSQADSAYGWQDSRPSAFGGFAQETRHPNGKLEQVFDDGRRVVTFPNGTRRHFLPDGRTQLQFSNGDCKCQHVDGTVEYFYAEVQTWHTTYPDRLEVFHFPNGQTEAHHPGGLKEVIFADGALRHAFPDGSETNVDTHQLSAAIQLPCPQIEEL